MAIGMISSAFADNRRTKNGMVPYTQVSFRKNACSVSPHEFKTQSSHTLDICKRHHIRIMTPRMIYDFNHPTMGAYHMKIFRDEAQHAADFLEYHIKGRLHRAKNRLTEQGMWAGRIIAPGFIVDMRQQLPDGTKNPDHRKYVPFQPYADVIPAYFELFKKKKRNLTATWRHGDILKNMDLSFPMMLRRKSPTVFAGENPSSDAPPLPDA